MSTIGPSRDEGRAACQDCDRLERFLSEATYRGKVSPRKLTSTHDAYILHLAEHLDTDHQDLARSIQAALEASDMYLEVHDPAVKGQLDSLRSTTQRERNGATGPNRTR